MDSNKIVNGILDTDCPVCFMPMDGNLDVCITRCGHKFHTGCIVRCNNTCPKCRKSLADIPTPPNNNTNQVTIAQFIAELIQKEVEEEEKFAERYKALLKENDIKKHSLLYGGRVSRSQEEAIAEQELQERRALYRRRLEEEEEQRRQDEKRRQEIMLEIKRKDEQEREARKQKSIWVRLFKW
jgi:hypothetical protein